MASEFRANDENFSDIYGKKFFLFEVTLLLKSGLKDKQETFFVLAPTELQAINQAKCGIENKTISASAKIVPFMIQGWSDNYYGETVTRRKVNLGVFLSSLDIGESFKFENSPQVCVKVHDACQLAFGKYLYSWNNRVAAASDQIVYKVEK